MNIKILFDKESGDGNYKTGWGLSYLVGDSILFDTGENFRDLSFNAERMGVDLKKIDRIVVSHEHWDHIGGLWDLLKIKPDIKVYVCRGTGEEFRQKLISEGIDTIEVTGPMEIVPGVYSTGPSPVVYKGSPLVEQGLVLVNGEELIVLFGCCHPGLINMLEKIRVVFSKKINCVAGGMHLMDKEKRFIDYVVDETYKLVDKVAPSHCTGFEAGTVFKEKFRDNFISVRVGDVINF